MPELPEVETIKNELLQYVAGRRATDITLLWDGIVRQPSPAEFRSRLIGRKITGITRRGKYLIFSLDSDDILVIHLKMSGALLVDQNSSEPPSYTRAILHLDRNTSIFFRDPRKFAAMRLVKDTSTILSKLGPEPLQPDFTPRLLAERLAKRKAPIKAVLIDQNFIAGIGNMYADEALFAARISPFRPANGLSSDEIERLHQAIQQVLRAGINNKGASVLNYYRPDGTLGTAHNEFKVAHRYGQPCLVCRTPIQRQKLRNRGTYFCPKCQG